MLGICVFGAGRIAKIHAANAALHPRAKVLYVVDIDAVAAKDLASRFGAIPLTDGGIRALEDPAVGAVIIASPTDTHFDIINAAARKRKAIFCEKPIDLNLTRVDEALRTVDAARIPFFVGFNRRFDPHFADLHKRLRAGQIGPLEMLTITSRDPSPPPANYVRSSGGLFRDMMIHDFDMARWLLAEEPVEVYASASCLVDKAIGQAGDIDTAMVTMKTASGKLCHIANSRRAIYGYDQRIEAFGAGGSLTAANPTQSTVSHWGAQGVVSDKPMHFFLERYADAYRREIDHFVSAVLDGIPLLTGAIDGRQALVLAEAADASWRSGKPSLFATQN